MDLEQLLKRLSIDTDLLMPRLEPDGFPVQLNCDAADPAPFAAYLPLEIFDNVEYDCRLADEWLSIGWVSSEHVRRPVPALALLPGRDDLSHCTYTIQSIHSVNIAVFIMGWLGRRVVSMLDSGAVGPGF